MTPTVQGMKPFDPVISLCIASLLAYILITGQRRYELLHMEIEALVRRYMIFRGKRHASMGKVQAQKGTNKKILKSISRSWYKFKEYYVERKDLIESNYRGMRRGFIVGCTLLALNTLREGIAGLLLTELPSGLFLGLLHSLPTYLVAAVGFVLLRSQKDEVYGTPTYQIDPALEAIFADFDQENPRLSEEFDPLEGEEEGE
jgi:hypothetical protein